MSCYVGIDIGTTNTKVLALTSDGRTDVVAATATPVYEAGGVSYFDVNRLHRELAAAVETARSRFEVRGIGFSSIGESVVPIDERGVRLSDPIVWYDKVTLETARDVLGGRRELFPYEERGLRSEHTLGVYKMLWMKENLERVSAVHRWLPVSSYIPYLWSGEMLWDFSQACRSYLLDIHRREWDEAALSELGFSGELPPADYMGTVIGTTRDGIPLYLGGHDHIVGMNGVRALFGQDTIFDSIGSASVLGGTVRMSADAMRAKLAAADDLIVGVSNEPGAYYAENAMRYFGKLLEAVARLLGAEDPARFYEEMNGRLATGGGATGSRGAVGGGAPGGAAGSEGASSHDYGALAPDLPLFFVEGDRVVRQSKTGVDIAGLDLSGNRERFVQGLYLYLAVMTKMVADELEEMFEEPLFVAGGGASRNRTLMQLTADVLGRSVSLLEQSELSALGAAVTAAESAGDGETVQNTRDALSLVTLDPSPRGAEAAERAATLQEKLLDRQ